MGKAILVECPECGRNAKVFEKQTTFICMDGDNCGFMCNMDKIYGQLSCIDDQWYFTKTQWE